MAKAKTLGEQAQSLLTQLADAGALQEAVALLEGLAQDKLTLRKSRAGSGRRRSTPRGSKEKGRAGVLAVRAWLLPYLQTLDSEIVEDDILIQTTSVGGSDLHLSPRVQRVWPFAPESKNVETLNVWLAMAQATQNATKRKLKPVLFFRRNNTELHIAFTAADFATYIEQIRILAITPEPPCPHSPMP